MPARRSSRRAELRWANSAPKAATPNVPPTIRLMVRIPDAPPAFDGSTAFIAAVDIGDITRPIPMPSRMKAGSSVP